MRTGAPSPLVPAKPPTAPAGAVTTRYPFVPYGLVPLAGLVALVLVALAPFAFGEIQAVTQATANRALTQAGADWARATASGQWVILEGRPGSRAEADHAVAAVRAARADTLLGPAPPATWVIEQFTWAEDPLRPSDIVRPRPGAGEAPAADPGPAPTAAEAACDQTMSGLLASARIEFATGSADVGAGSGGLLQAIASAAAACPGVLRIEGYTDDVGSDADNIVLSRRRAEAVRTSLISHGVAPARLVAEGFGAARPVADNGTSSGRARNRRIEIRSIPAPPP